MLKNEEFVGVVNRLGSNGEGIIKEEAEAPDIEEAEELL